MDNLFPFIFIHDKCIVSHHLLNPPLKIVGPVIHMYNFWSIGMTFGTARVSLSASILSDVQDGGCLS